MRSLTLQIELSDPYDVAGRALDMARRMGFELIRLRLDPAGRGKHRMIIGLAPHGGPDWCQCLHDRLAGTPGIVKVSLRPD